MEAAWGLIHGFWRPQKVWSVSWQVSPYRLHWALLPSDDCCYVIRKFQSLKTRRYCYWRQTSCSRPSMNRQEGQFRKPLGLGNRNNDLLGLNCISCLLWVRWRLICNVTVYLHEPESFLRSYFLSYSKNSLHFMKWLWHFSAFPVYFILKIKIYDWTQVITWLCLQFRAIIFCQIIH